MIEAPFHRGSVLALAALALAFSVWLGSALPLLDPDEGRNAEVGREMLASGDFLVPRLADMPYLDKPPALFWAEAASMAVLGRSPLAVRLPSVLAACAILLLVGFAAGRRHGTGFALRAMALLAAAPLFAVLSSYVIFDMMLALCVTLVWLGVIGEIESGPAPGRRAVMFAAVALGILVKGPVMLAWAIGGSLATAAVARDRGAMRWLGWLPGWGIVLATAGLWFALATLRHPEYPRYAFLEESFERMTSGSFKREQPWWFVPAVLAGGALPWSLVTPWIQRRARAESQHQDAAARAALGFLLFAAIFFTLSRSKLVTYLVPVFPPLAWLAAAAWRESMPVRRSAIVAGVLLLGLGLAASFWGWGPIAYVPGAQPSPAVIASYRALGLGFLAAALLALAGGVLRKRRWVLAATLSFTPMLIVLGFPLLRDQFLARSGAPLAIAIERQGGATVRCQGCYSPGTDFVLGRRSSWTSRDGQETASTYQARYRELLRSRGQWTAEDPATGNPAEIVVVPPREAAKSTPPGVEFFRDDRFVAFRRSGSHP